jgi:hypothetical protein
MNKGNVTATRGSTPEGEWVMWPPPPARFEVINGELRIRFPRGEEDSILKWLAEVVLPFLEQQTRQARIDALERQSRR